MKPKFFIILLLLIVVPAMFLSVMAARALYNWDIILQKRLQAQAYTAASTVKDRVDTALQDELIKVVSMMMVANANESDLRELVSASKELEVSGKLIKQIYIYTNLRVFLYPDTTELSPVEDKLLLILEGKVEFVTPSTKPLYFNVGSRSYCFSSVSGSEVYVGYEVSTLEFYSMVQTMLKKSSAELIIYAESNDLFIMPTKQVQLIGAKNVIIEDPFEKEIKPPYETVIAQVKLRAPFNRITIKARIKDEAKLRKIATIRRSVSGWVILLLVFGIATGVIIVWHSAVSEIKKARTRSNYVAGISHDLRTPLASMKILTETLLLGKVKDSNVQKKFLETISKEITRLNQLVERVLFFVRYGQDALVFKLEPNDIAATINNSIEIMGERLCMNEKNYNCKGEEGLLSDLVYEHIFKINAITTVQINVNIADNLSPAQLDFAAIMQVLLNFLDNAVKYSSTPTSQPENIKIDIQARRCTMKRFCLKKEWLMITIRDYGIGIEKKNQHKIFERFYRSPRAIHQNISGVGLGLSLCKHIIKEHGGKITVDSKIDEGSEFSIYLPVLRQFP